MALDDQDHASNNERAVPRRTRVLAAVLLAALAAPATAASSLRERLAHALAVHGVSLAASGAEVVDLETGRTVFAHNATRPLLPASNEKLAITYAALTALGPGFRIETDVLGDGAQTGRAWHGDLVLKGYGDPSLSSYDLTVLARRVQADGIARVTGRVVGDESWFDTRRTGVGWKPSFAMVESPLLSALIVKRGIVRGRASHDPALAAAQLFRSALLRAGVRIAGPAVVGRAAVDAVPLAAVESPPVAALVRFMDHESDNFTAEMLLKEVGAVQGDAGTAADGLGVVASLLTDAGVPRAGLRLVDGSGLSLLDRWTPAALVSLLRAMWDDPGVRPELLAALPVAGRTGTLADRMRRGPARGVVRAKTGSTSNASALSGFVGDRYVFSVIENGRPVATTSSELAQDRFATVLASLAH